MNGKTVTERHAGHAAWEMKFDYIESCNCLVSCPCPFTGAPTFGNCHLIMGFHVTEGRYESTSLSGLNAIMVNDVPGNMRAGGYRTAVYVDERGDAAQQFAIESVFSGKEGGVFAGFAALTNQWLGVRRVPIEISIRRSIMSIPRILNLSYEPMKGAGGRNAALVDTGQRIALGKRLNVGMATESRFEDFGIDWNNAGCNVFWGRFTHSRKPT